jgi:hypothetical protein
MDFVEQCGHTLHFIEDHYASRRQIAHLCRQECRVGQEDLVTRLVQEVYEVRIGKFDPCPAAFADAANSEQEETSFRGRDQARVPGIVNHAVILPCILTTTWQGEIIGDFSMNEANALIELDLAQLRA